MSAASLLSGVLNTNFSDRGLEPQPACPLYPLLQQVLQQGLESMTVASRASAAEVRVTVRGQTGAGKSTLISPLIGSCIETKDSKLEDCGKEPCPLYPLLSQVLANRAALVRVILCSRGQMGAGKSTLITRLIGSCLETKGSKLSPDCGKESVNTAIAALLDSGFTTLYGTARTFIQSLRSCVIGVSSQCGDISIVQYMSRAKQHVQFMQPVNVMLTTTSFVSLFHSAWQNASEHLLGFAACRPVTIGVLDTTISGERMNTTQTTWQTLDENIAMLSTGTMSFVSTLLALLLSVLRTAIRQPVPKFILLLTLLSTLSHLKISNKHSAPKSLLVLVLLCTAQPTQSYLTGINPQLGLRTQAVDGTFIVPLLGSPNTGYCAMIAIGMEIRQEFCVLVDTGSSNLAVAGSDNQDIDEWFHVEDSSSYTDRGKSVTVTYTAGQWTGRLSTDLISVGGSQEVEAFFAVITESQNFFIHDAEWVGIMGLAYSSLAKPDSSVTPFWDAFRAATGMRDVFSLQLCQPLDIPLLDITEPQGGRMVLGGFNGSYYHPPMFYTSIVQEKFYNVLVTNLTIGDTVVNLDCSEFNNDQSIVDSGTTDIYFPQKVFTELRKILIQDFEGGVPLIVPETFWNGGAKLAWPVDDKHTIYGAFPTLYISFASDGTPDEEFSLAVTPQIYLRQVEGTAAEQQQLNCFPECDFFTFGIKQRQRGTVIGGNVMLGFYTVFDRENKRVGFAQSTCQFQDTTSAESIPHIVGPYPREPADCSCSVCERKLPYWEIISYVCGAVVLPLAVFAVCIAASGKVIQCYRSRSRRRCLLVCCCNTCQKARDDDDEHLGSSDSCGMCMVKCRKLINPCWSAISCCCYRKRNFTLLDQPTDDIDTADLECGHLSHAASLVPQHQSNDEVEIVTVDSENSFPHSPEGTVESSDHSWRGDEPEESRAQKPIESESCETTVEIHSEVRIDDIDQETSETMELIPRQKLVLSHERGHRSVAVIAPVVETGAAGNMQKLSKQFEDLEQDRKAASAKKEIVRTKPVIIVGPKRNHIKPSGYKKSAGIVRTSPVENPKLTSLEKKEQDADSEKTVTPQLIPNTDEEESREEQRTESNLKTNNSEHPSYNVSSVVPTRLSDIFQDPDKLECKAKVEEEEDSGAVACKQEQTDSSDCGDKSLKAGPVQECCDLARQASSSSSASSGVTSRQSSWNSQICSRQNSLFDTDDDCLHKYTKRQNST